MALSTQLIAGLSSGLDWRSMIDQLIAVEREPVKLVEKKKTEYEEQLTEWQSFNTMLFSLKTAATTLGSETAFNVFSTSATSDTSTAASDLLNVSAGSSASHGTYAIKVNRLALSERISSKNYSDTTTALGLTGDMVISGKAIEIESTDTLAGIKDKINALNTGSDPSGVTASIVSYDSANYHLILTSDDTGEAGFSILEGAYSGGDNVLQELGFISSTTQIKNATSDGAQSDLFSSSNGTISTLLGLTNSPGATTVQINGSNVDIDLSAESLTTIAANIDALTGVTASVVSQAVDGETKYQLDISGTTSFSDNGNVLQALGILKGTYSTIAEVHTGSVANTTDGATPIARDTQWDGINGANVQAGTSFTITGKDHDGNDVSGSFNISGTTAQVSELLDYIQDTVFSGTVAVDINAEGQIEITDSTEGDSQLELAVVTNNVGSGTLDFGTISMATEGRAMQLSEGQDAKIEVDNVVITSASNTVKDVIQGVTMNLVGVDTDTTVTLKVERDLEAIIEEISGFVDAFNEVFAYIHDQKAYDVEKKEAGGILFADGTLSSVKSDITTTLLESVWGVDRSFSTLGLVGIELDSVISGEDYKPQLTIDTDKLEGYLQTNFHDVKNLFIASGTPSASTLEYVSSTNDTNAGNYTVNITQAATQSSTASDTAVGGTLGADETLTITDGNKTATVALTSSMTISDIANAINSELDSIDTQVLVGDQALTASSSPITSATTWGSIDGNSLSNGDAVAFSGTTRKGISVEGSYTINDTATDTVQGLLSAAEEAFGNAISASIDSSGRLVITDIFEGDSQLSVTITEPVGKGLDFGTVDVTDGTGDGSQQGRYAMPITATNDGSDHLQLTYDYYGSSYSFSVSEDTDSGLWTGSQTTPVTADNGLDVVGTINGEAATGSGQTLIGNDGEANVDGMVLKYTGSSTGDVGEVTFTVGVGELFDRTLFNITDTYEGYVTFKQDSLQSSIDSFKIKIDEMEARLDQKMEMMINRFVAMEVALATIQSQSQWLASQINGLNT